MKTKSRTPLLMGLGLFVSLLAIGLIAGDNSSSSGGPDLSPDSTAPNGTRGLVIMLRELGGNVRVGQRLPDADTHVALLLQDGLDDDGRAQLASWVEAGNTVVVGDVASPLAPEGVRFSVPGAEASSRVCDMPELADVSQINVDNTFSFRVPPGSTSCFGDGEQASVVSTPRGRGRVVAVANVEMLTNARLDQADNSVLAARLLLPAEPAPIAVLDPNPPGSGHTTLGDLITDRVFQAILQLGVAFLVYALWRSRRVGRPVIEPQPVAIAGSQFVRAVGGLQQRSRATDRAAGTLRVDTRRLLSERYGIPFTTDAETLAQLVATRTGLDRRQVATALGETPVLDEAALVTLGRQLDDIRQEVLDGHTR